jgi:hypothetical protein
MEIFSPFFENEYIRIEAIEKILSDLSLAPNDHDYYHYSILISYMIKENDLPILFNTIQAKDFYITVHSYIERGTPLSLKLKEHLIEQFGYEEPKNMPDVWEKRRKEEFDIYFSQEAFKKECLDLFDSLNTNTINPKKLIKENHENNTYINLSLLWFLKWFAGDKKEASKEELSGWFEKYPAYFEEYLNIRIFENIRDMQEGKQLSDSQILHISDWYYQRIETANFQISINKINKNSFSMNKDAILLIFYMKKFNFDCPEEKLCEILNNPQVEFEFIIKRIKDKVLLNNQITENIKNFKEHYDSRIIRQCEYAMENNIKESQPYILEILKSDFDDSNKSLLLDYWFTNNLPARSVLNLKTEFNQNILIGLSQLLIKKGETTEAKHILENIFENPDNDEIRLSVINLLIWMKDLNALRLSIDYSKEKKIISLHDPFYGVRLEINMPDNYLLYDDIKALPLLMEYLEFCFDENISHKREIGNRKIENNLLHLALQSEKNRDIVITVLQEFIVNQRDKIQDIDALNFTIERIKQQYIDKYAQRYTFREAQTICKEIFLQ